MRTACRRAPPSGRVVSTLSTTRVIISVLYHFQAQQLIVALPKLPKDALAFGAKHVLVAATVLSSLMALSIMESPSRLFDHFPMPAFVGTDAAKALRVLEPFDMLLNRATGDACRGDHLRKGYLRIAADHLQQSVDGFLTTFSYHLATRLSPSTYEGACQR